MHNAHPLTFMISQPNIIIIAYFYLNLLFNIYNHIDNEKRLQNVLEIVIKCVLNFNSSFVFKTIRTDSVNFVNIEYVRKRSTINLFA